MGGSGECLGAGEPIVGSYPVRQLNPETPGFGGCEFGCALELTILRLQIAKKLVGLHRRWKLSIESAVAIIIFIYCYYIVIHYIYIYQDCINFIEWDPEVFYGLMFRGVLMAILKIG